VSAISAVDQGNRGEVISGPRCAAE